MSNSTKSPAKFDDDYWRQNYSSRLYIEEGMKFEDYQLAYQVGHEGYDHYSGKSFDEAQTELKRDYEASVSKQQQVGLDWDRVKDAVRDAWDQAGSS